MTPLEAARVTCHDSRVVDLVARAIEEDREQRARAVEGLDLAAIRARCEAATPGPWAREEYEDGDQGEGPTGVYPGSRGPIVEGRTIVRYYQPKGPEDGDGVEELAEAYCNHDAAFIAHARTDVPALLARVEELTARLAAPAEMESADALAVRMVVDLDDHEDKEKAVAARDAQWAARLAAAEAALCDVLRGLREALGAVEFVELVSFAAKVRKERDAAQAELAQRLSAVDEGAMRVALAGGCCARHVALGFARDEVVADPCGPLTRTDVDSVIGAVTHMASRGYTVGPLATLRVLAATLAGRMP